MADGEKQKNNMSFVICPRCGGTGRFDGKHCLECDGRGIFAWTGNYVLYWGRIINETHILHRKITEAVYDGIDFILMIVGITGFAFAFYGFAKAIEANGMDISSLLFWRENTLMIFIAWISFASDSYLFYRFARRIEKWPKMPDDIRFVPLSENSTPWESMKAQMNANSLDISGVFTIDAIRAVEKSYELGKKYNYSELNPIHLFISLLTFPEITSIFVRLGISFSELRGKLSRAIAENSLPQKNKVGISADFYKALFHSFAWAFSSHEKSVYISDLLAGTIRE